MLEKPSLKTTIRDPGFRRDDDAKNRAVNSSRLVEPTPEALAEAGARVRRGGLVAFPTETVYGLGADATQGLAVAAIYSAKGRPSFNPLIIHVESALNAAQLVTFTPLAERLAEAFWPGPLTLVLPRTLACPVADLAGAGLATLAVRVPAHPVALAFLRAAARPVAAPSANPSGTLSPTRAEHVMAAFDESVVPFVLEGGPGAVGLESTVVDLTEDTPTILRPGGVTREALERIVGGRVRVAHEDPTAPRSPGMLARHYAPGKPVRLNARAVEPDEALLAFGPDAAIPGGVARVNLSPRGDLVEAAAHLFSMMRTLEQTPCRRMAVMPIPDEGLGLAINDRLRRAAHPATEGTDEGGT